MKSSKDAPQRHFVWLVSLPRRDARKEKIWGSGEEHALPFAVGDLINSASVLKNYMENAPTKVPWDDLRYLFGEIMYGRSYCQ